MNSSRSHHRHFRRPELVPEWLVGDGRDPRVEIDAGNAPALGRTDSLRKQLRVIVGVRVAKGLLGCVEEVLTVEEGESAFCRWLSRYLLPRIKNNPARGPKADPAGGRFRNDSLTTVSNRPTNLSTCLSFFLYPEKSIDGLEESLLFRRGKGCNLVEPSQDLQTGVLRSHSLFAIQPEDLVS